MYQNFNAVILTQTDLLKQEVKCTICLDLFTEPITLTTCQHTFCLECFKGLFSNDSSSKSISCPICKRLTNRRSYYKNEHFVATIDLIKMYESLIKPSNQAESAKDDCDIYDRANRIEKFLDDCMMYQGSESVECISLSSSDDESKSILMKKEHNNHPKPKVSKTSIRKTKSLNCSKIKGKYPRKLQKKSTETVIIFDEVKIDEFVSPDVGELEKEENKIVKLLEDDCLRNIEIEFQNINNDEQRIESNDVHKDEKSNKKQPKKCESNLNSKSAESNSSKRTATSTGWSRMKTMKKQIKKKEVKYKQLNVSTEINKSKSKSPEDKNTKPLLSAKDKTPIVVLNRFDSHMVQNENKLPELENKSADIKIENISTEKIDLLLQCIEEDKNKNQEDDVFSLCTQKLQNPEKNNQQKDLDEIGKCSAEKKNSDIELERFKSDVENNLAKFIAHVQVHNSSTPIKNSNESSKVNKKVRRSADKKLSDESVDIISASERTPSSENQLGTKTRRSLRSATKRKSDEHILPLENKATPKKRKVYERNSNKVIHIDLEENVSKRQEGNEISENKKLTNEKNITDEIHIGLEENVSKKQEGNKITSNEISENKKLTNEKNITEEFIVKKDFVANEIKMISEQEPVMMTALQNNVHAINVVLSHCSNYVSSESLFSDSWPSKGSKESDNNKETKSNDKPKALPDHFCSLPLKSNSRSSLNFYATAIPCLKNLKDLCNQIISLSQQISNETENFKNIYNCSEENSENIIVSFKKKCTKDVESQTDNMCCPKCSYIIDLKPADNAISLKENTVSRYFNEINNLDFISNENNSQLSKDQSLSSKISLISNENSQKSIASNIIQTKKVNRQLTYSDDTSTSERRKFKRIRSPTSDSDSESTSKKSKTNYSDLMYRNDVDIFFRSEPSQKIQNLSLSSQTNDKETKKIFKRYDKILKADEEKNTSINPEDTTSKYISMLEREYKDAQFDNISKPDQGAEKHTFDTAPNTVLDNLLGSINLSVFENDNFEPDNKISEKKTELTAPLFTDTEQRSILIEKKTDNSFPDVLSASMLNTEKEVHKMTDIDKTKSIEKIHLNDVTNNLAGHNNEDQELDKEVENLTNHDLVFDDSFGSNKDIFEEDVVENTPQKTMESKRARNKFEFTEQLPDPILDILEPPSTVTEKLDWIDIAPPPPPEFQDTEKIEEPVSNVPNVSSITPDIFALGHLDKGFFLSGNTTMKEPTQTDIQQKSVDLKNRNSIIQEDEVERKDQANPKNTTIIPSNSQCKTSKRNLNPIVLAQKEKFSPLQIMVNSNPVKQVISSTPKHQKSILNYMQTPNKENNANETNRNASRSSTPKQNSNNKPNTFKPIKENVQIEVCESPVPESNVPSTSFKEDNKIINKSSNNSNSSLLGKSKNNYCIACTRLKRDEMTSIIAFTLKLKAKYNKDFDKNVTHVIVSVDDRNRVKDHTIKYVLAIAHGVWILSYAWIRDSIAHNRFLPEEPYEVLDVSGIPGPRTSRLTGLSNPLFKNFIFCCIDPFTSVIKSDIESAIISLGGTIRKLSTELAIPQGKHCLILAEAKDTQDFDQFQVWRIAFNVLVVDMEWFSRTVGQYQITSVRPYLLCLDDGISDLGYPFALIAPVPETPSQMTMTNTNH